MRGGYGIFFLPRNIQGNGNGAVEAVRTTSMVASLDQGVTTYNTINDPFPVSQGGILPALNDRDPLANVGQTIAAPTYGFRNGYSQTWSFGAQRQLPWGMVMDVHYWGAKSTRLQTSWNINQLPNQYLPIGQGLTAQVTNPFRGLINSGALASNTISRQQSLLPFPQYTAVTRVFVPAANSTYEAGTLQLEKRLSEDLTFLAVYTRAKSIDDVRTPYDVYNRRLEKALSAFDSPNQFRFSGVWRIPFGRGRALGGNLNRVANFFLGGWSLNGIVTLQSGFPISLGSRAINNNGRSARLDSPTIGRWFDTSVFAVAPAYTFGNTGPFLPDVRNDWTNNVDAVLVKQFALHIGERAITTQFRSEFYNLFNRPQFGNPNGTITSQQFGQVTSQANNPRDLQFGLKVFF